MILAIDASTTSVGWALFFEDSEGDGEFASSGTFLPIGDKAEDRIADYGLWLLDLLETNAKIHVVAYEIASGAHGNMRTNRLLGGVEYLTRWVVRDCKNVEFVPVRTAQGRAAGAHKKNLGFAGLVRGKPFKWKSKAEKKRCGDEADAIGIGLAAQRLLRRKELVSVS